MQPYKAKELIEVLKEIKSDEVHDMDQGHEINDENYLACCGNGQLIDNVGLAETMARDALFHQDGKLKGGSVTALRAAGFNVTEERDPEEPYINYAKITIPADEDAGHDEDRTLTLTASLL